MTHLLCVLLLLLHRRCTGTLLLSLELLSLLLQPLAICVQRSVRRLILRRRRLLLLPLSFSLRSSISALFRHGALPLLFC
jgi:hypothetical protein